MKNLVIITSMLLLTFAAKAQTQAETITWLQEKLDKYLRDEHKIYNGSQGQVIIELVSLKVTEITPCAITIVLKTNGKGAFANMEQIHVMPTDHIRFDSKGSFMYLFSYNDWVHTDNSFSLYEGEEDLRQRVEKAIAHLATFCPKPPVKKETF